MNGQTDGDNRQTDGDNRQTDGDNLQIICLLCAYIYVQQKK